MLNRIIASAVGAFIAVRILDCVDHYGYLRAKARMEAAKGASENV